MGSIAQVSDLADDLEMSVEHVLADGGREFPKLVYQWQDLRIGEPQEEKEVMKKALFEEDAIFLPVRHSVRMHLCSPSAHLGIGPVVAAQQALGETGGVENFLHRQEGIAPFDMTNGEESLVIGGQSSMQKRGAAARLADNEHGMHRRLSISGEQEFVEIPKQRVEGSHQRIAEEKQRLPASGLPGDALGGRANKATP